MTRSDLVSSGDDVADENALAQFLEQYDTDHDLVADGDSKYTLEVGDDFWPLPIPIVKVGDQWTFDIDAAIDEIVYRRIGRNELGAIEACRGIVEAQTEYAAEGRDGLPAGIYAQKLVSDKGKHNGLYWPAEPGAAGKPGRSVHRRGRRRGLRQGEGHGGQSAAVSRLHLSPADRARSRRRRAAPRTT